MFFLIFWDFGWVLGPLVGDSFSHKVKHAGCPNVLLLALLFFSNLRVCRTFAEVSFMAGLFTNHDVFHSMDRNLQARDCILECEEHKHTIVTTSTIGRKILSELFLRRFGKFVTFPYSTWETPGAQVTRLKY